jgi:glycosyltransferase involved in cell wall biosynthesis
VPADRNLRLLTRPRTRGLQRGSAAVVAGLRRRPASADLLASHLRSAVREELASFKPDVVQVSSRLAGLGPMLAGVPTVLAALDARHRNVAARMEHTPGPGRLLLALEHQSVRHFEATAYRRFGHVVTVTDDDRGALLELDPYLRVSVIPNGVDSATYAPQPDVTVEPGRIVFTGVLDYAPNITAAETLAQRVLPLVRAKHPEAHLFLVGRRPTPAVAALGLLPGVTVTGEVEAVQPYLASANAYVCAMRSGTGIKNKLLEAMAVGAPCVATPLALQGMSCRDGDQLLVGDSDVQLAEAIGRILDDGALARRLAAAGRSYVLAHHSWDAVAQRYAEVYDSVRTAATKMR